MPTLFATGMLVGSGADLTEDILQTYTLPGNTLFYTGDILHIVAGGNFAGTTDAKTARMRLGGVTGVILAAPVGNAASSTKWAMSAWVLKTGAGTQSFSALADVVNLQTDGTSAGTATLDDTAAIQIVVTGQNATNSVAGSINAQYFHVRLVR